VATLSPPGQTWNSTLGARGLRGRVVRLAWDGPAFIFHVVPECAIITALVVCEMPLALLIHADIVLLVVTVIAGHHIALIQDLMILLATDLAPAVVCCAALIGAQSATSIPIVVIGRP